MKYIYLILLFIFSSCGFLIKKIGGVKNPKIESFHSINVYANSIGVDSSQVIFVKDSMSNNEVYKAFNGINPDILFFNKNGNLIAYKDDVKTCNATVDSSLINACNIEKVAYPTKREIKCSDFIKLFVDPNHVFNSLGIEEYDYIVFVNFTKYFHGTNKTHVVPWDQEFKKNRKTRTCKVKMVFINQDYLDIWNLKSSPPKIKIKAN